MVTILIISGIILGLVGAWWYACEKIEALNKKHGGHVWECMNKAMAKYAEKHHGMCTNAHGNCDDDYCDCNAFSVEVVAHILRHLPS